MTSLKGFYPLKVLSYPATVLLASVLLFLAGCASLTFEELKNDISDNPSRGAYIEDVPLYPQTTHMCGPSALLGVLNFYGKNLTIEEVTGAVYEPELKGTLAMDMLLYAKREGFDAAYYKGGLDDLKERLREGRPVIVFLNLGTKIYPVGHFAVAVGYSDDRGVVILHSGTEMNKIVSYKKFLKAWERTGFSTLLILPKEEEKPSAKEESAPKERGESEVTGPKDPALYFRRGNLSLKHGDAEGAVREYLKAIELDPEEGAFYNNLAWAYIELERFSDALGAIEKALKLDGENLAYLDTLGVVRTRLGDFEGAYYAFEEALKNLSEGEQGARCIIYTHLLSLPKEIEGSVRDLIDAYNLSVCREGAPETGP